VLPSLNVPIAEYPTVEAGASTFAFGFTAINVSVAELTFNGTAAVTLLKVALIFVLPGATAVTIPTGRAVATATLSDAHVTSRVMICMLESLNEPVATNDNLVPGAIVRFTGVTEIDTMVALVTLSVIEALTLSNVALMITDPGLMPFIKPLAPPSFAIPASDEVQVACVVRSRVPPSLKVPIAESCWLVLAAIVTLPGRIVIDARSAALTLAEAVPLTEPETALIVTVPRLRAVAKPLTVIDTTLVLDELQVTVPVMSCVVASENVPVAVNCCNVPSGSDALAGETAMEFKVALVMVSVALEETAPEVAVMVATPGAIPIASPRAPFTLMVAAEALAEAHCTDVVKFCMLPSVNVPVAAN